MRVFQILAGSRASRGRPLVNMLPLSEDERITAILPVHEYRQDEFIFMATTNGTVKKSPLVNFARQRSTGLIAIELEDDNTLVGVAITDGTKDVMLFSSSGKVIRFKESNVRAMGRAARGVRGIKLKPGEEMISLIIPADNGQILIASENGYGKRTRLDEFSVIGRGGQGMIAMKTGGRNGAVVGAVQVYGDDEMILISDQGILVRTRTEEVSMQVRSLSEENFQTRHGRVRPQFGEGNPSRVFVKNAKQRAPPDKGVHVCAPVLCDFQYRYKLCRLLAK